MFVCYSSCPPIAAASVRGLPEQGPELRAASTQAHVALQVSKSWQNHFILSDPEKFHEVCQ